MALAHAAGSSLCRGPWPQSGGPERGLGSWGRSDVTGALASRPGNSGFREPATGRGGWRVAVQMLRSLDGVAGRGACGGEDLSVASWV